MGDTQMPAAAALPAALTPDPITAILVAVTEIRGLVGGLVDDVKRQESELTNLRRKSDDREHRLTIVETRLATIPEKVVSAAAMWTVLGIAAAALGALAAVLALFLGH